MQHRAVHSFRAVIDAVETLERILVLSPPDGRENDEEPVLPLERLALVHLPERILPRLQAGRPELLFPVLYCGKYVPEICEEFVVDFLGVIESTIIRSSLMIFA